MKFAAIASTVFLASLWSVGATEEENKAGPPFFLIDKSDQLCLAGEEFKRCSIDTLWYVQGNSGKIIHASKKWLAVDDVIAMVSAESKCPLNSHRSWFPYISLIRCLSNSQASHQPYRALALHRNRKFSRAWMLICGMKCPKHASDRSWFLLLSQSPPKMY